MNQLLERYGKLPRSQRLLLAGLVYVAIVVVFWFSLVSPTLDEIDGAQATNRDLVTKRDQVRARAANRAAFEAELEGLAAQLKQALKELPNDREIPGLLSEIDGYARKAGLDVRRFQPLPEVMHEYFAEVPVQIVMDGSFHEIAIFFDKVRKMGRIVSVRDIDLSDPVDSGTEATLKASAQAVTYRFLTDKEIEENRNRPKREGGGGGGAE